MGIDIVDARDNIVARLAPVKTTYQAEVLAKSAKDFGEPVTDLSINVTCRGASLNNQGNYNGQRIVAITIQVLLLFWNPLNVDDIQAIARACDALLDRWEPVTDPVKPLEWQNEGEVNIQGLEGKQSYQLTYQFEVLK